MVISVKTPAECSASELADFAAFVRAGGEVISVGLEQRIASAHALVFLCDGECLLGIAALKNPSSRYRAYVFKKASAALKPETFHLELGWIFLLPSSRGKGLSHQLVNVAVAHVARTQMFATSRSDNASMHKSLVAAGFVKHGLEYSSRDGSTKIGLFLRTVTPQEHSTNPK